MENKIYLIYCSLPIKIIDTFDMHTEYLMNDIIVSRKELIKAIESYELEYYNLPQLLHDNWINFRDKAYKSKSCILF